MATFNHMILRAAIFSAVLFAAVGLGGCAGMKNAMSGEVLGASVTVGGFTVGLSGKFPQSDD